MRAYNKISGIDTIGEISWGTHFCQFYQTKEDLLEILVPYFKAGIENLECCIWVTSEILDLKEAKEALRKVLPDINALIENDQIEFISYPNRGSDESTLSPQMALNHLIKKAHRALANGYNGLRYSGDIFCGYEKILDSAIGKYPIRALCTYHADKCNANASLDIASNHQFALIKREEEWVQVEGSNRKNTIDTKLTEKSLLKKEERYRMLFDRDGKYLGAVSMLTDSTEITERKEAGSKLKDTVDNLEKKIKDRTSELEEAYNSLKESEESLAEAQKMAHIGNWKWDVKTNELRWSDEVYRIFGLKPQEFKVTFDTYFYYIHPEDRDHIINSVKEALKGKPYIVDNRIITANGEERIIHTEAEFIFNEENIPVFAKGIVQDITARRKVEVKLEETLDNLEKVIEERTVELRKAYESLKESERGLSYAQKIAHIGSWDHNFLNDEVRWSEEMYAIFGLIPQEPITHDKFLSFVHSDDRDYVYNSTKDAFNGKIYATEYRIVRSDGEERIVHAEKEVIFNEKNKPIRMRGTIQDITERKRIERSLRESEQKFSLLFDKSPVASVLFKLPEIVIVEVNKSFEMQVGFTRQEMLGKTTVELGIIRHDLRKKAISNFDKKGSLKDEEMCIFTRSGEERIVLINTNPLELNGQPYAFCSVVDITERKKAEEELTKMEKIRIKEIHHRIKNNLQVISSLLDLQIEKFSHLDVCRAREVIEAFLESQNRVVSMALIHEELYKGNKIDTLDFAAYLRKLTEDLFCSYNPKDKNINLKLDLEQVYLGMDTAIPLGIIVNELISNSFKHAFPSGRKGEIEVNLSRIGDLAIKNKISSLNKDFKEKNCFDHILKVSDNGKGISKEVDLENMDSLGLQLVNILVKQLDGFLDIKSDTGTEFTIWFNNVKT